MKTIKKNERTSVSGAGSQLQKQEKYIMKFLMSKKPPEIIRFVRSKNFTTLLIVVCVQIYAYTTLLQSCTLSNDLFGVLIR
jgi:hypothetical protein